MAPCSPGKCRGILLRRLNRSVPPDMLPPTPFVTCLSDLCRRVRGHHPNALTTTAGWVMDDLDTQVALIGFRGLMLQALSEKHNSFLRLLTKKGFKEERVTTIRLYDIGKSHDPGIQQEPRKIDHD